MKKVVLIIPSRIIARGIESLLCDQGEFRVDCILSNISHSNEITLAKLDADIVLVDPIIFDYKSRAEGKSIISQWTDAPVVALNLITLNEEALRNYDAVINICDDPVNMVRKLRDAISSQNEAVENDVLELTAREKEILVCVAKGMLNKEIADECNLSIHTVITHRKNITRKTGIKTVAGLTVYALLNNLIDPSSIEM